MTTPAVNDFSQQFGTLTQGWYDGSSYTNPGGLTKLHWEVRPQSGTCEFEGRFKLARSWTHKGADIVVPSNELVLLDKLGRMYVTFNGSIWNSDGLSLSELHEVASANSQNRALVQCLNKLKAQDFHLGNFLAEAKRTLHLVKGGASTIANGVQAFRRKYPGLWPIVRAYQTGRLPRHLWCKIPSAWLELQYGWKPLMSDIFGAANHLAERSRFAVPFVTVKSGDWNDDVVVQRHSAYVGFDRWVDVSWSRSRKAFVSLTYGMENPVLAELSSLGLVNPAEIVWELARYSFVVDWFLPLGNWLSALTADVGYKFITGAMSLKTESRVLSSRSYGEHPNFPNYRVGSFSNNTWKGSADAFQRIAFKTSPIPGVYVKNPLSAIHAANAIALLAVAFRDKVPIKALKR